MKDYSFENTTLIHLIFFLLNAIVKETSTGKSCWCVGTLASSSGHSSSEEDFHYDYGLSREEDSWKNNSGCHKQEREDFLCNMFQNISKLS